MTVDQNAARRQLLALLNSTKHYAFLTGAGVSTNSGIPDFHTIDEHWPFPVPRAEATSVSFFHKDPIMFWEAFRYLFTLKDDVKPNNFHEAIASLESKGKSVAVLTQNVDGLHTKAGSSNVIELHGNIVWAKCSRKSCPERKLLSELASEQAPRCERCSKYLRPDVVLFGEDPQHWNEARSAALDSTVFIVAGTSLDVGPVNQLPLLRDWHRPELPQVWLNRFLAPHGYNFSHALHGDLSRAADLLFAID